MLAIVLVLAATGTLGGLLVGWYIRGLGWHVEPEAWPEHDDQWHPAEDPSDSAGA